jgi:G3E family GTPase
MRTAVILVTGQEGTTAVSRELLHHPGTVLIEHHVDGNEVLRRVLKVQRGIVTTAQETLELQHGCLSCTVRNDVLVLLRRMSRRRDVERVVVRLAPWLEPEPICWAIHHVRVTAVGLEPGPAARDVEIRAVITTVDEMVWLAGALGDEELPDGRTEAQAVVAQAEFADVLVCGQPPAALTEVLARLNPRAPVITNADAIEDALRRLPADARRGRSDDPHDSLLARLPPLHAAEAVQLFEFHAQRPFHPERLHDAVDALLDSVIRSRGRLWLASNDRHVMWLESAGGGLRVSPAGPWLAAMSASELAYADAERRALSGAFWDDRHGDRHTALVVLACGADPDAIREALQGALLTDDEMSDPGIWPVLHDPFGQWHHDPCTEPVTAQAVTGESNGNKGEHE